ncbi:MAG: 2-oxoisovalerate dehydrogenase, partial [Bdellovibrionales bacterium]|nr:2-oxoisovalerate dehydrogenase [Bdellovibrionales bacterium]
MAKEIASNKKTKKSDSYGPVGVGKTQLLDWYKTLRLGRTLDERAPNYLKQALGWSYHAPCAGHDAIQLAIGHIFSHKAGDHFFPYYRDLISCLSAGITPKEIILNGISKATDPGSGGRHMSNHFAKPEWNIHNVSSCTGNHTLHAVGVARAIKKYKGTGVSISSQGESSVSEGYCYEAINGADKEELPVIFVFQDNGYGISVPKSDQTANEKVADNFSGFINTTIIHCDGKDVYDSIKAMTKAKEICLKGKGPVIVHADCVRIGAHSNSDKHELYRDEKELEEAKAQDPIKMFENELIEAGILTKSALEKITEQTKDIVLKAHREAVKAPSPDGSSIYQFVYPEEYQVTSYPHGVHEFEGEPKKLITAINETLKSEFRYNEDTFLWGQDIANKDKGGIFNVSKGMQQEFGKDRVFNAPIAEDFIVGTANGFSRYDEKIRVVVEGAEFADYFWPAMEQLIECSHDYWRSNGAFSPNIVIRLASGGYIGGGLYHSQNLEGVFTTLPGIRVVCPSFADDAAGLLRTAMRSKGPTIYLEPKTLYNAKSAMTPIPEDFEVPFGQARIRKEGTDLTVITYGNTTHFSLEAAEELEKEGYSVEVIDLRSLIPLDKSAIINSIQKTNRAIVIHEDKVYGGFGGELVSIIMSEAFELLDAPVNRVGSTFTPVG